MNTQERPVRVHSLRTQNILGIEDVELTFGPDDSLVIVGGDNGAGKTSLIDSLFFAIGGKPDAKRPIRDGAESGDIRLDLGDLVVTRRFRAKEDGEWATDIKVENGEGARYSSPQKLLDALISKFAFDPFEFTNLKEKDQEELVRTSLGLDTSEIDAEYKEAFEKRALVHQQLKEIEVKTKDLPWYEDAPEDEVSIADLQEELRLANEHNGRITDAKNDATAFRTQKITAGRDTLGRQEEHVQTIRKQIEELTKQLAEAEKKLASNAATVAEWEKEGAELEKAAAALGDPIDTAAIIAKLQGVQETNEQVRANKQRIQARTEWHAKEDIRVELEKKLEDLRTQKAKLTQTAVSGAKLAVEGLELTDDGLFLKGLPFRQCNTAEKLKLSVALAVKQNPRLRIFRIADGEKLTPHNMQALRQIAEDAGAQILVEFACTREDIEKGYRDVSVFIEEGRLAEVKRPVKEAVLA
jgi:DNA repair exonuclease SbcCD ATPase subunit